MDRAAEELERRSRYLSGLIREQKKRDDPQPPLAKPKPQHLLAKPKPPHPLLAKPKPNAVLGKDELELAVEKEEELEWKSKMKVEVDERGGRKENEGEEQKKNLRIRASDMPPELQKRAFQSAREALASMPKLDSKRLALTLKKEFDSSYGPAWHCVVGTSFGSYVTHSLGGFLYFSIDKVHILLFRTVVQPLPQ